MDAHLPAHHLPGDIERTSLSILNAELEAQGVRLSGPCAPVIRRVIHATADFDFARALHFTPGAVEAGISALRAGAPLVLDTNMALAGVSQPSLARLGSAAHCLMAEEAVAQQARAEGTTRAVAAARRAAQLYPQAVFAVGNAPTALLELADRIEAGLRPSLVVGVPVGFVNVVESKERALDVCSRFGVPAILAMGRKGGSSVAVAICNALLYAAVHAEDPADRGWQ